MVRGLTLGPQRGANSALVAFGIIAVVLLLCGVGYYFFTHSPKYAADQMMQAIAAKDTRTFDKYVNLDLVAAQVMKSAQSRLESAANGTELGSGIIGAIARRVEGKASGQLQERVKNGILQRVSAGSFSWDQVADLETKPLKDIAAEMVSANPSSFQGITGVTRSGVVAEVSMNYQTSEGLRGVTLEMKKVPSGWEVVGISKQGS